MSQLRFLEECARQEPGVRVVYAGTRQIYGTPQYLPVDERHPIQPVDFNGVHKYAATAYHLLWSGLGRIDARVLCLTNIYGPRLAIRLSDQGFLGNFLRRGLLAQTIEIFGDGRQLRDPVYVEYALWMNDHGVLRFINRLPIFRYKPPPPVPPEQAALPPAIAVAPVAAE